MLLALLWGSTFLWIDIALQELSPALVTSSRCLLGAATLVAACVLRGVRLPRALSTWRHVFVAAIFCNALPFYLFSYGQQTVASGLAGVLNATTPLWSILLGLTLGHDRQSARLRLVGLVVGFSGTVLIFAPWQRDHAVGPGAVAILGAAASYAIAFTYMRTYLVRTGQPILALSAAQLLAATMLSVAAWPGTDLPCSAVSPQTWVAVGVLGVFTTGVTFHLTYRIIADEGPSDAATVGYLLPVVSVALGAAFLDEDLGLRTVLGGVVAVAGVALTRRRDPLPSLGLRDATRRRRSV